MRDIKINHKTATIRPVIKTNKIVERKDPSKEYAKVISSFTKSTRSYFSTILFAFMSMSIFCYVFLISSSIYFAVKTSQYAYKTENLPSIASADSETVDLKLNTSTNRISYINKKGDTAISMK